MTLADFKKTFDPQLEAYLDARLRALTNLIADPALELIFSHTRKIALAGGKRVRPYATDVFYRAGQGENRIEPILCALEIFHLFALVHDDIMDHGKKRHEQSTLHEFAAARSVSASLSRRAHVGDALAILMGDMLFAFAHELWHEAAENFETASYRMARKIWGDMIREVVAGQMLDIDTTDRPFVDRELLDRRVRYKTAGYTFARPFAIGAALAGGDAKLLALAETLGWPLGIAFQLEDDLLDLTPNPREPGKTPFSDLIEGQHTHLTAFIMHSGTPAQKSELQARFGQAVNDPEAVLKLFKESGAIDHARALADQKFNEAEAALREAELPIEAHEELQALVALLRNRLPTYDART